MRPDEGQVGQRFRITAPKYHPATPWWFIVEVITTPSHTRPRHAFCVVESSASAKASGWVVGHVDHYGFGPNAFHVEPLPEVWFEVTEA